MTSLYNENQEFNKIDRTEIKRLQTLKSFHNIILHMSGKLSLKKPSLGTSAVFFTAISTILGAIMFLRFGFAVGQLGLWYSILLIIAAHMVTIPTAMAIAEIATNQKVEGGGEYFIISRSFGLNIGGAIGVTLFLSQAISVAFYIIAFAQAFDPLRHIL